MFLRLCGALLYLAMSASIIAVPEVSVTPMSHDFGQKVITDAVPFILRIEIQSEDSEPLEFTGAGITLTGPDVAEFAFTTTPSLAAIPSLDSRFYYVAFSPSSVGAKSTTLTITTNAPANPSISIPLSGSGIEPRPSVFHGPYTGHGPGQSTIGTGGDYESLFAATQALGEHGLTGGDWDFLILNDLIEPNNSSITQSNMSGYSVTFRPAPETNPIVTFTTTTLNPARFPGHIHVGAIPRQLGNKPFWSGEYIPTHNICFDGSNSTAEATRSLTLRNDENSEATTVIVVAGNCDNVSIKNCRIIGTRTTDNTFSDISGGIEFLYEGGADQRNRVADNALIQNCEIVTTGPKSSNAIIYNEYISSFPENAGDNLTIKNNLIKTCGSGFSAWLVNNSILEGNTIYLRQPKSNISEQAGIIYYAPELNSHTVITGNTVRFAPDTAEMEVLEGIAFGGVYTTNTVLVSNNFISGLSAPPVTNNDAVRYGIRHSGGVFSTMTAAHNSIHFYRHPVNFSNTQVGHCAGIFNGQRTGGNYSNHFGNLIAINNIISMDVDGAAGIYSDTNPDRLSSNHNNFHVPPTTYVASTMNLPQNTSLVEWQMQSGNDLNSITQNPFQPAGGATGTWTIPDDPHNPNMHFTAFPGDEYLAPTVDGVTTDIDDEARGVPMTVIGADEVVETADVEQWMLY